MVAVVVATGRGGCVALVGVAEVVDVIALQLAVVEVVLMGAEVVELVVVVERDDWFKVADAAVVAVENAEALVVEVVVPLLMLLVL